MLGMVGRVGKHGRAASSGLSFNFLNGAVDNRWTYARSSNAWYMRNGLLLSAASGAPRFETDASGNPLGLLTEPQSTNLITSSNVFGGWTAAGGSVTAGTIMALESGMTGSTYADDTSTGSHGLTDNIVTVSSGTTYTGSMFAKTGTLTILQMGGKMAQFGANVWANYDLVGGTITANGTAGTYGMTSMGGGWWRCWWTAPATASGGPAFWFGGVSNNPTATRAPAYTGTSQYSYVWEAQVEAVPSTTSQIRTTGSSQTRTADSLYLALAQFPALQTSAGLAMIVKANALQLAGQFMGFSPGGFVNGATYASQSNPVDLSVVGGIGANSTGIIAVGALTKMGISYIPGGNATVATNGGTPISSASSPSVVQSYASVLSDPWSFTTTGGGHVQSVQLSTALSPAALQARTQ